MGEIDEIWKEIKEKYTTDSEDYFDNIIKMLEGIVEFLKAVRERGYSLYDALAWIQDKMVEIQNEIPQMYVECECGLNKMIDETLRETNEFVNLIELSKILAYFNEQIDVLNRKIDKIISILENKYDTNKVEDYVVKECYEDDC